MDIYDFLHYSHVIIVIAIVMYYVAIGLLHSYIASYIYLLHISPVIIRNTESDS